MKKKIQDLHIKISKYQYCIILILSLLTSFLFYIHRQMISPIQGYQGYEYYDDGIFKVLAPIVFGLSALSIILRFIPDIIYRKHIFTESFAIKIFIDYFCRIIVILISLLCAVFVCTYPN